MQKNEKPKFVWIDLEMTGLNTQIDKILEVACVITTHDLTVIEQSPALIIHQPEDVLQHMNQWNMVHHTQSGLLDAVRVSTTTIEDAEMQLLNIIKKYCKAQKAPLCGNSIWVDRLFLQKFMPTLEQHLHYRTIDVSTLKLLAQHWFDIKIDDILKKQQKHRVLDDIHESINELSWYRHHIFKQN
jgi:oligoribonuclease